MQVSGVFLNLNSTDPQGLMAFYRDVIGLPPQPDMGEGALNAGNCTLGFDGHSELSGRAKDPKRTLLNFSVDDIVAEQARLEAAGVRFLTTGGAPQPEEITFSTFEDPDGNYAQIYQAGDAFPKGPRQLVIARHCSNVDAMRAFYRDVVGLSDDFPHLGNPFMAGETSIYVSPHTEVSGPATEPTRILIDLFVDDVAAEENRISAAGAPFIRRQGREFWGGIISTFIDPEGNYVQIIGMDPVAAQPAATDAS
jgi:predicted enzyme related to lactoylglutathione lyase